MDDDGSVRYPIRGCILRVNHRANAVKRIPTLAALAPPRRARPRPGPHSEGGRTREVDLDDDGSVRRLPARHADLVLLHLKRTHSLPSIYSMHTPPPERRTLASVHLHSLDDDGSVCRLPARHSNLVLLHLKWTHSLPSIYSIHTPLHENRKLVSVHLHS